MKTLLLEVLTEEIPAGYIVPALEAMAALLKQRLSQARVGYGEARVFGTPRRLAVVIEGVEERQPPVTEEILGPPKKAAYDADGHPTRAAEGFAKGQGVDVSRLIVKATAKGEYVCVKKVDRGKKTLTLLQTILPEVITAVPFPKSMRWSDLRLAFARPIHAVLALLGDRIVSFRLANLKSGRRTRGHRFMHPNWISVRDASDYAGALQAAFVEVDIGRRKAQVRAAIDGAAQALGGRVIEDCELLDTVTHLVEYPAVSAGTFDQTFLQVPREVLITAMREHQKYFAVVDENNQLLASFVAVNNTPVKDVAVVTAGHERVLRARLEDARFFFEADVKVPLHETVDRLGGVLFQAKLGTMLEKVTRVRRLAEHLAERTAPELKDTVSRAAWLCKADLTSQMVNEFPKLQGVMGRIYATRSGEPAPVARAIEEHYLPAYAGGPLPETTAGALVSMADKLDTICGCFGAGLIPTGTTDPYALRRQALGVIHMLLARGLSISLGALVKKSLELLAAKVFEAPVETAGKVLAFFQYRMEHLLAEQGFSKDVIAAVASASIDDVPGVLKRTEALENLKAKADFEPLAVAFKRVVNIIRKARQQGELTAETAVQARPALFREPSETALYEAVQKVRADVEADLQRRAFGEALLKIAALKGPVDAFFDGVMVLAEDRQLRQNRLALLGEIAALFSGFADFSRLSA